jgi:hypothetical protein
VAGINCRHIDQQLPQPAQILQPVRELFSSAAFAAHASLLFLCEGVPVRIAGGVCLKGKEIFVERCALCHNQRGDKPLQTGAPLNERGLSTDVAQPCGLLFIRVNVGDGHAGHKSIDSKRRP